MAKRETKTTKAVAGKAAAPKAPRVLRKKVYEVSMAGTWRRVDRANVLPDLCLHWTIGEGSSEEVKGLAQPGRWRMRRVAPTAAV